MASSETLTCPPVASTLTPNDQRRLARGQLSEIRWDRYKGQQLYGLNLSYLDLRDYGLQNITFVDCFVRGTVVPYSDGVTLRDCTA